MEHNPPTMGDYAWAEARKVGEENDHLHTRILVLEKNVNELGTKLNEVIAYVNTITDHLNEQEKA